VDLKDSWPLRALRLPFQQRNARHIQGSQITLSTEECPPNQIRSTKPKHLEIPTGNIGSSTMSFTHSSGGGEVHQHSVAFERRSCIGSGDASGLHIPWESLVMEIVHSMATACI